MSISFNVFSLFQIILIFQMPSYISAINCNGNHRGVKNCSALRVAKLTISTGRRVAGMLYSML